MMIRVPSHLPTRLTITLWDFSWMTQSLPGEPFEDLDKVFAEAVERGYNTVRICALPLTLFGPGAPYANALAMDRLGGEFGQRTRWYRCRGGAVVDGRTRLLNLFQAAKRHHVVVILSSWEYQQTPAFFATPTISDILYAIPAEDRFLALARSMDALLHFLADHGFSEQVAYVELHNEVEYSALADVADNSSTNSLAEQKPFLEQALHYLQERHPDVLVTTCYAYPALHRFSDLANNLQVAHFHCYVYGVLEELMQRAGLREDPTVAFPNRFASALLKEDAPPFEDWDLPADAKWRTRATRVDRRLFYLHDWADPERWDRFLYEHYGEYRVAMQETLATRLNAYADVGRERAIPVVIGEGWVGYTPLEAQFEEGPIGKKVIEDAVRMTLDLDYWGIILCSNAAPHHPFWQDVTWQQKMNRTILGSTGRF